VSGCGSENGADPERTNVQAYRKLLADRLAEHEWKLEVCGKLAEARGDDYFTTKRAAAEYTLLLEAFDRNFPDLAVDRRGSSL